MLRSILFDHWKSFGDVDSQPALQLSPLTLLVGPNGSGKSNVIDALRFLQGVAFDYPFGDVLRGRWEGQRQIWPGIRGAVVEAAQSGRDRFAVETGWDLDGEVVQHILLVSTTGDVALESEALGSAGGYWFDTNAPPLKNRSGRQPGGGIRAALRGTGSGNSPSAEYSSARSLLGQVELFDRVRSDVVAVAHTVRRKLREAVFLDIRPSLMREYRPQNGSHLGTAGENISPVLAALPEDQRDDIVGWLAELCAPEVVGVEFDITQLREVMMMIVEKGGRKTSARSASDGTLKFLGVVVALLTAPAGSLLVLEEPDVGLHPSRIRLLVELFEYATKERDVQIIATTHSSPMLAQLKPETLADVIAFARDPGTGDTRCERVGDLPYFDRLRDSKDSEHLLSTGWLERAL